MSEMSVYSNKSKWCYIPEGLSSSYYFFMLMLMVNVAMKHGTFCIHVNGMGPFVFILMTTAEMKH
jgi:hypothetical protein